MPRDLAGLREARDAASRAPPGGTGGRAPAARTRKAPGGRGEEAEGRRQARSQSPDKLVRNFLFRSADEGARLGARAPSSRGMGEDDGARARDGLSRQTPTSGMSTSPRGRRALRANHPRQNQLHKTAAPNADKRTDSTAPGRSIPALQDRDFSGGAGSAMSCSLSLRHLLS